MNTTLSRTDLPSRQVARAARESRIRAGLHNAGGNGEQGRDAAHDRRRKRAQAGREHRSVRSDPARMESIPVERARSEGGVRSRLGVHARDRPLEGYGCERGTRGPDRGQVCRRFGYGLDPGRRGVPGREWR